MFTEKYKPKRSEDIIGQKFLKEKLKKVIQNKGIVILSGPVGCGKTSAVYAIANELDYELIKINSAKQITKEEISNTIKGTITQQSLFNKKKILLIEGIEELSLDKLFFGSLFDNKKCSVVLTTNDLWSNKLNSIRRKCELIDFLPLSLYEIFIALQKICVSEPLDISEKTLKDIAENAKGDLRAAIIDLETRGFSEEGQREKKETIFRALDSIFKGKTIAQAINVFDNTTILLDECFLWLDENLPRVYTSTELQDAYRWLSKADVFRGRIKRQQHWRFLTHINELITAGIAVSGKGKNIVYKRNSRILKLWLAKQRLMKKRSIAKKLGEKIKMSEKKVFRDVLPFLSIRPEEAEAFKQEFELGDEEI